MEAICFHLCDKIREPRRCPNVGGIVQYTSRWKLVLSEYSRVQARLFNSQALLEGTNMVLFTINETTLVRWYKNLTRMNQIKLLLQGHPLELTPHLSEQHLPPTLEKQPIPPPPKEPFSFEEQPDTRDEARVRGRSNIPHLSSDEPGPSAAKQLSRTTEWRRKKKMGTAPKHCKQYSCKACGQIMSLGDHTQYKGWGKGTAPQRMGYLGRNG